MTVKALPPVDRLLPLSYFVLTIGVLLTSTLRSKQNNKNPPTPKHTHHKKRKKKSELTELSEILQVSSLQERKQKRTQHCQETAFDNDAVTTPTFATPIFQLFCSLFVFSYAPICCFILDQV